MGDCTCKTTLNTLCDACCGIMSDKELKLPPLGVVSEVDLTKGDNGIEGGDDGVEWVHEIHHDANGIRESMAADHPGHYSPERKSHETREFEMVLGAIAGEREELESEEAVLLERLESVRERLSVVSPIEDTMTWLQAHIFNYDHKVKSIRDILPTSPVYNKLMLRYHRLKNSKEIVDTASGVKKLRSILDGSPRGWRCELCYRGFQCEEDLKRHVASNCEYHGNEEFQKLEELKRDIRSRSCEVCSFKSSSTGGLKTHMRIKHPDYYAVKFGKTPKKGKK